MSLRISWLKVIKIRLKRVNNKRKTSSTTRKNTGYQEEIKGYKS